MPFMMHNKFSASSSHVPRDRNVFYIMLQGKTFFFQKIMRNLFHFLQIIHEEHIMLCACLTQDWPYVILDPLLDLQTDGTIGHCTRTNAYTGKKYSNSWVYNKNLFFGCTIDYYSWSYKIKCKLPHSITWCKERQIYASLGLLFLDIQHNTHYPQSLTIF